MGAKARKKISPTPLTDEQLRQLSKDEIFDYFHRVYEIFQEKQTDQNVKRMREASGEFDANDILITFFYLLIRDVVTPGTISKYMLMASNANSEDESDATQFTNGWLAMYAEYVVDYLLENRNTLSDTRG